MRTNCQLIYNYKIIYISLLMCAGIFSVRHAHSQSPEIPLPEHPKNIDRIVVGGSAWLSLGSSTYIELYPLVGYRLSDRFSVLAGPMYSYYHDYVYDASDNIYGARALARFFPINNLFLQAEMDNISYKLSGMPTRINSTYPLLGVGYYQYGSTLEIMYIANRAANTPFINPFQIRVGFIFYLSGSK